jgi:hypothetical protein
MYINGAQTRKMICEGASRPASLLRAHAPTRSTRRSRSAIAPRLSSLLAHEAIALDSIYSRERANKLAVAQ